MSADAAFTGGLTSGGGAGAGSGGGGGPKASPSHRLHRSSGGASVAPNNSILREIAALQNRLHNQIERTHYTHPLSGPFTTDRPKYNPPVPSSVGGGGAGSVGSTSAAALAAQHALAAATLTSAMNAAASATATSAAAIRNSTGVTSSNTNTGATGTGSERKSQPLTPPRLFNSQARHNRRYVCI